MSRLLLSSALLLPASALANPTAQCGQFQGQAFGQCVAWFANGCDVDASQPACSQLTNPFPVQLLKSVDFSWAGTSRVDAGVTPELAAWINGSTCPNRVGDDTVIDQPGTYVIDASTESDWAASSACLASDWYTYWGVRFLGYGGSATGELAGLMEGADITSVEVHVHDVNKQFAYSNAYGDYWSSWGDLTIEVYGIPAN